MGLPEARPEGLDSPVTGKVIKYMAKAQVAAFKATNGRIGKNWRIGAGWKKPVPTLLLEGGDSPDPFRAAGRALQAALPDGRIAVMPGQRHAAMDTGTDLFLTETLTFLDTSRSV